MFFKLLRVAVIPLAWLLVCPPARAIKSWESEDGDYSLELTGSERLTGAFLHNPDIPALFPDGDDGLGSSVTRLLMHGDLGKILGYEANFFLELSRTPPLLVGGAFDTAGSFETPYRTRYMEGEFWENGSMVGRGGVDRLAFVLDVEPVKISVGRLPVNYSVTNIFTPNDFFAPFSATAINTVYKPGVDALRISLAPGMLSSIELLGVLGSDDKDVPSWSRSALLLRARTVVNEVEWALLGGKLAERWALGGSMQASAGPFNIRTEGHVGFPDHNGDFELDDPELSLLSGDSRRWNTVHARLAAGFDVMFNWHNASIGCEYFYLSDGARGADEYPGRLDYLYPDDLLFLGRHYLGVTMGGEIIPILQLVAMGMLNMQDHSGLAVVTLVYSIADEADLVFGVMTPWGRAPDTSGLVPELQSEYGQSPLNLFFETRVYF